MMGGNNELTYNQTIFPLPLIAIDAITHTEQPMVAATDTSGVALTKVDKLGAIINPFSCFNLTDPFTNEEFFMIILFVIKPMFHITLWIRCIYSEIATDKILTKNLSNFVQCFIF